MLSSSASQHRGGVDRRRRSRRRPASRSARTSSWICCSRVGASGRGLTGDRTLAVRDRPRPSTSCISRASRPHDSSRGLRGAAAVGSSRREQRRDAGPTWPASRSHSAGDGWSRKRWTSRPAADGVEDVEIARRAGGSGRTGTVGAAGRAAPAPPAVAGRRRAAARPGSAARCVPAAVATARPARRPRPSAAVAGGPALQHLGSVHGVAVEEVGHVPDAREALRLLHGLRVADVLGQRRQPRLVEVLLDHLHQRPDRTLRAARDRPRDRCPTARASALFTSVPGNGKSMLAHTPSCAPSRAPEVRRQSLGQPALDAPRRHRDDLGGHRIVERLGHQVAQHRHQGVGPVGPVDVQHPGRVRRRCSPGPGTAGSVELPCPGDCVSRPESHADDRCCAAALGQGQDVRLPDPDLLVLVAQHLDRLEVARRRLDRARARAISRRVAADDAEAGELAGRRRAPAISSEPTALL